MRVRSSFTLAFLIVCGSFLTCNAQNIRPTFSCNGGVGIPLKDFATKDVAHKETGWADPGFAFGFDLGIRCGKIPLWFAAAYKNISNPVDFATASAEIAQTYRGLDYEFTRVPWRSRTFLTGLYTRINFDSAGVFSISPRALVGSMSLTPYQLHVTLPQSYHGPVYFTPRAAEKGFAYLFGLSFRYAFFNSFFAALNVDYLHSVIEFNMYNSKSYSYGTYSQTVELLNLSLAIGVKW